MNKNIIGKRVRKQREHLGMTRDQFAELVEVSPQFLAEIENGKKGMSADTLYKICDKGNVSADYILMGRQLSKESNTPAVETLLKIPPKYSEEIENLLDNFLRTINKSENND